MKLATKNKKPSQRIENPGGFNSGTFWTRLAMTFSISTLLIKND
jgi:hypothetical protein